MLLVKQWDAYYPCNIWSHLQLLEGHNLHNLIFTTLLANSTELMISLIFLGK